MHQAHKFPTNALSEGLIVATHNLGPELFLGMERFSHVLGVSPAIRTIAWP